MRNKFAQSLREARWIVDPVNKTSLADLPGVVAVYRPFNGSPPGVQFAVDALKAAGVPHEIGMLDEESSKTFGVDKVYLLVGRRAP